ncbi:MAG: protein kinase [Deltaproteobacteria bacterium]|nr:protein kinase [Deltaproteobacteria bacterium]
MSDAELVARLGRIHREQKLDESGRGEVWSAKCEDRGPVAIKIFTIDEERCDDKTRQEEQDNVLFLTSLRRAISLLPHLRNPGLPDVYDGGVMKGAAFMVMELLIGKSARDLLRFDDAAPQAKSVFTVEQREVETEVTENVDVTIGISERLENDQRLRQVEVLRMARDLFSALAAIEEIGLPHGDIRLEHLFLREDGGWVLLGAGTRLAAPKRVKERDQLVLMAPERLRGEHATFQCDVYSVGAVLFRMLHGFFPFDEKSPIKLVSKILTGEAAPFSDDVEESFKSIVSSALFRDAQQRPSAASLAVQCAELLADALHDDDEAQEILDVPGATQWCLEQVADGSFAAVVERLRTRPELLTQPSLTLAIWEAHADTLLRPLYEGAPMLRSLALLLSMLKESVPDLIAMLSDWENLESTRVNATRLLALAKVPEALPYMVPLLNESFAWLQRAVWSSVVDIDPNLPIAFSALSQELSLFDGDLSECRPIGSEQEGSLRLHCAAQNVEVLPAHASLAFAQLPRRGRGFFAAPYAAPPDGEEKKINLDETKSTSFQEAAITLLSEAGSFDIAPFTTLTIGSSKKCDLIVVGLEPLHGLMEHVGDGRLSVRAVGDNVDDEALFEAILESGDAGMVSLGPLQMLASFEDPRIMLFAGRGTGSMELPKGATSFSASFDFNETFAEAEQGIFGKMRRLFRK